MQKLTSVLLCLSVVACGGGSGGGSSNSSSPLTLNLNEAYASMLKNGNSVLYTLAGDCTGTSSQTSLPGYDGKNWANPPIEAAVVEKLQFDSLSTESKASVACSRVFNSNNGDINTTFYSKNYQTVVNSGGSNYWEVYSEQSPLPTTVTAGSSGTLYKWKNYQGASSTSGAPVTRGDVTYAVAADSDSSLLVTITETGYDEATGKLGWTWTTTYRLNSNNTLTNLSFAINATENSPLGAPLKVSGNSTSSVTLNAQAAQIATLSAARNYSYTVFDSDGNQCTPSANLSVAQISSVSGTTSKGVQYAKSNTTTFSPQAFTGNGRCSSFSLPLSENSYYDANYALVQQTTNNNASSSSTSVATSTSQAPASVSINSTGKLYAFDRFSSSNPTTPFASGNVIYYVGALSPTKLAFFEVQTKNYTNNGYTARQIFVSEMTQDSVLTPMYGYIRDSGTYRLIPTSLSSN